MHDGGGVVCPEGWTGIRDGRLYHDLQAAASSCCCLTKISVVEPGRPEAPVCTGRVKEGQWVPLQYGVLTLNPLGRDTCLCQSCVLPAQAAGQQCSNLWFCCFTGQLSPVVDSWRAAVWSCLIDVRCKRLMPPLTMVMA